MNTNLYEKVAKRRAKAQRPLLLKFLQEIGYDDIFNVDEVKEIKSLYDKAQEEMKDNLINEVNDNPIEAETNRKLQEVGALNQEIKSQVLSKKIEFRAHFDSIWGVHCL
jgi:hypothetical protein